MIEKLKLWLVSSFAGKYLAKGAKALVVLVSGALLGYNVPPEVVEKFGTALEAVLIALGGVLITWLG